MTDDEQQRMWLDDFDALFQEKLTNAEDHRYF